MSKLTNKGRTQPAKSGFDAKAGRVPPERPNVPAGREIERRLAAKDKPRFGMAEIGRKTK
jgi:hypothetical protein